MSSAPTQSHMPPRKVVVFGGDGFIGSHLVDRLVAGGHEVSAFARFRNNVSKNLTHLAGHFRMLPGDFSHRDAVAAALKGQEAAYHCITASNPVLGWNNPYGEIDHELRNAVQFFDLCTQQGVRKVVYASSGGTVYGPGCPVDENAVPHPYNPYGICRLAAEHFLDYFRARNGLATDVYRIGNVFGPRQPLHASQGVIAVWMGHILEGKPLQVFGDETTLRDYVYAEDAAELMTFSLRDLASSGTYNIGSGQGTSILHLLDMFRAVVDKPFDYNIQPRRPSDNPCAILPSGKLLGLCPEFRFQDLQETLRRTWEHLKANAPANG